MINSGNQFFLMRKLNAPFTAFLVVFSCFSFHSVAQENHSPAPGKVIAGKSHRYFTFPDGVFESDCQEKTVVLKLKPKYSNILLLNDLNTYLSQIGGKDFRRKFPHALKPETEANALGQKYADLTRIYQFSYSASLPLETVINTVYSMNIAEYAEPNYIMKPLYTVNDPSLSQQWHINKIKANLAWDVNKGDTNIVVGIVDSEIQYDHPDLSPNIKYNYADPIDGQDNDGDGYVDNYRGYDLGEDDSDTKSTSNIHGSHVSGCSSAATDNSVGVAGSGFKCKFLPVKIANSSGSLIAGYEGIVYAADHGVKVINCSWGSAGGGQAGQDVIDYATLNKDVLVVASAGNDATEAELFPAAYNYVLSVAATTSNDKRASFSSYGTWVDVSAPGENIYATYPTNSYSNLSGTSMSSPVTAGAAAIVKSNYSFLNMLQVGEQVRVTCDPMSTETQWTAGKMGKGRINLFAAVSGINSPSIVMTSKNITDNGDEAFVPGDTLEITATFVNYLLASGNITATLTTTTPTYITIVDGTTSLGSIALMGTANNNSDPYKVVIKAGTPINAKANFVITLTDGSYTTKAYVSFTVNVDYINIAINEVATTITSKSLIGFNDFSTQLEGLGFRYMPGDGENLLFDGGLMVGQSGKVSDNVRSSPNPNDADFVSVTRVAKVMPVVSEFDVKGVFDDNGAGTAKLPVQVSHQAFAWNTPGHRRYVMVKYSIKNTGTSALNSLYAGIYTDWDINMGSSTGYNDNKAATDQARSLGYSYNMEQGGFYAGVQLLTTSNAGFVHYAMDNNAGTTGVHPNVSYNTADKFTTLSTMRTTAGSPPDAGYLGRDVSNAVSGGPFNIPAGDSVTIAFALLGGDDLADLQKSADSACANYPFSLLATKTSPTCGNSNGTATVSVVGCGSVYTYLWSNGQTSATATGLIAGNYAVTVTNPYGRKSIRIVSVSNINGPSAGISSTDATCGSPDGTAAASVSGGTTPYTYLWSNSATTASITGLAPGNYLVTVTDANNCIATGMATVNSSSDLFVSTSSTDATCGGSNGSATATVSGGVSPYTYLWSTGATTAQITNVAAQTYTVTVSDAGGCSVPMSVTVYSPGSPSVSVSATNANCSFADGSATASVSGGTSPYTYLWSQGGSTAVISSLAAGSYSVTVTDSSGCAVTGTATVYSSSSIQLATSSSVASCGNSNGTATASVSGGTTPISYLWSTGANTSQINNLSGQTYYVTVTDAANCSLQDSVTVSSTASPSVSVSVTNATCSSANGSATASGTGGSSPYTYLWSGGQTSASISNLVSGNYLVTITDSNGCTDTASAFVNSSSTIVITTSSTTASCGNANGSASASVSGGTTPYTYLWSTGATTAQVSGLTGQTYSVTVTDGAGCAVPATVSVGSTTSPVVSVSSTDATCGSVDGTASATVSSGTSPYSYLWSNSETTPGIDSLSAGNYSVTVTDFNGCTVVSQQVTISVTTSPAAVITASGPTTFCQGGSVTLSGNQASSYLWSNGQTTASIVVNQSGVFTVTITNIGGCVGTEISQPVTITVNQNPTPIVTAGGPSSFCPGDSVSLTSTLASAYLWSNGQTSQSITVSTAGDYSVTVTNSSGCNGSSSPVSVTVFPAPASPVITASGPTTFCQGGSVDLTSSAASSFLWSTTATTQSISVSSSGSYSVTITDQNGCKGASAGTLVTVNPNPGVPVITAGGPNTFCAGGSLVLTSSSSAGNLWSDGAVTQATTVNATGNYTVTVTQNGCSSTSLPFAVTVNPLPPTPVITQNNNALGCSVGGMAVYSWEYNALPDTTCNAQVCICTGNGFYGVTITDGNGCSSSSALTSVTGCTTGIERTDNESTVTVFPNPNGGKFTLVVSDGRFQNSGIRIFNILGELVFQSSVSGNQSSFPLDLKNAGSSLYYIQLVSEHGMVVKKIVVE